MVTSLIYALRPLILAIYVKRHYNLNWNIKYTEEPIKQKWNGVAQHVSAVVLDGTDNIVLTIFSDLKDVSIYSVYSIVTSGVKQLLLSMTNGIQALMGEMWAKQELDELKDFFGWIEWILHTGTILIFGITSALIIPFIEVYTKGISDDNYLIAATLNIIISVVAVRALGLVGVALGTVIAMFYQTVWMAWYDSKNLIKWPFKNFLKQIFVDGLIVVLLHLFIHLSFLKTWFEMKSVTYFSWIVIAVKISILVIFISAIINIVFYRTHIRLAVEKSINKIRK